MKKNKNSKTIKTLRKDYDTLGYNHPLGHLGRRHTPSNIFLDPSQTYEDNRRYTIIEGDINRRNVSHLKF
jgi:hypothetical protein